MATRRRTAVLISGRGSNMQALIAAAEAPDYPADIVLVVSNRPAAAGLDFARAHDIAAVAIDHTSFGSREAFEDELHGTLAAHDIELVACAGFMRILSGGFVEKWHGRMVNIHPSLLPAYRGLHTHERALADGATEHGCTVHFVVPELDSGPVIAQSGVPVLAGDTPDSLAARVLKVEHAVYPPALAAVANGSVRLENGIAVRQEEPAGDGNGW